MQNVTWLPIKLSHDTALCAANKFNRLRERPCVATLKNAKSHLHSQALLLLYSVFVRATACTWATQWLKIMGNQVLICPLYPFLSATFIRPSLSAKLVVRNPTLFSCDTGSVYFQYPIIYFGHRYPMGEPCRGRIAPHFGWEFWFQKWLVRWNVLNNPDM